MALLLEARTAIDIARMTVPLLRSLARRSDVGRGRAVMVVPGYGSDDRYTIPLRHHLRRRGYHAEGWGLGKNRAGLDLPHELDDLSPHWAVERKEPYRGEGSVPYLCDRLTARVRERSAALGRPLALIGWSLGGYLAREVARDAPEAVEQVITLGSPVTGGPKYTALARRFRRRGMDLDWIEAEIARREARPIRRPIMAIYSRSDAIVAWPAALDHYSENVTHIEVDVPHLGLGFNPEVWAHIDDSLDRQPVFRSA